MVRELSSFIKVAKIDKFNSFIDILDIIVDMSKQEFFFVMEFAAETLDEMLLRLKEAEIGEQVSSNAAKDMIFQILLGLDVMHANNILHRDLKLENILVMPNGQLKICDFGLAKISHFRQRRKSDTVCTLPYRAPEICLSEENYGTSVDSWSMGVIIAEIIQKG